MPLKSERRTKKKDSKENKSHKEMALAHIFNNIRLDHLNVGQHSSIQVIMH